MAKILYLGAASENCTSYHRFTTLKRLGHHVNIESPYKEVDNFTQIVQLIHYRTGYRFLQNRMRKWIERIIHNDDDLDLIWVNSGELFGKRCLKQLQQLNVPIVLYNNDDPTGGRDGNRFKSLLTAIPYYDLCVLTREISSKEFNERGAKNVMRVWMSYDEVAHQPFDDCSEIPDQYQSEVAFIGTWMRGEKRDEFMLALADAGIKISIWGARWKKSSYWYRLKKYYRGAPLSGRNYVAAIQGAKICIGLLSKENRDLHTRRSVEIPYAGGLLCAERTSEHLQLYEEGKEAVFWDDAQECVQKCKKLLKDEEWRERIRRAGMKRIRELNLGNEDICKKILDAVEDIDAH